MQKIIKYCSALLLAIAVFATAIPVQAATDDETSIQVSTVDGTLRGGRVSSVFVDVTITENTNPSDNEIRLTFPKKALHQESVKTINFQGGTDGLFVVKELTETSDAIIATVSIDRSAINGATFSGRFSFNFTTPPFYQSDRATFVAEFAGKSASSEVRIINGTSPNTRPIAVKSFSKIATMQAGVDDNHPEYGSFVYLLPPADGVYTNEFAQNKAGTPMRMSARSNGVQQDNVELSVTLPSEWNFLQLAPEHVFPNSSPVNEVALKDTLLAGGYARVSRSADDDRTQAALSYDVKTARDRYSVVTNADGSQTLKFFVPTIASTEDVNLDFGIYYTGENFNKGTIILDMKSDQLHEQSYLGITFPKTTSDAVDIQLAAQQAVTYDSTMTYHLTVDVLQPILREQLVINIPLAQQELVTLTNATTNGVADEQINVQSSLDDIQVKNSKQALQVGDTVELSYTVKNTGTNAAVTVVPKLTLSAGFVSYPSVTVREGTFSANDFTTQEQTLSSDAILAAAQTTISDNHAQLSVGAIHDAQGVLRATLDSGRKTATFQPGTYSVELQAQDSVNAHAHKTVQMTIQPLNQRFVPAVENGSIDFRPLPVQNTAAINLSQVNQLTQRSVWQRPETSALNFNEDGVLSFYGMNNFLLLQMGLLLILLIPILLLLLGFYYSRRLQKAGDNFKRQD